MSRKTLVSINSQESKSGSFESDLLELYKKLKYYSKDTKEKILINKTGTVIKNKNAASKIAGYFSRIGETKEVKDKSLKRYQLNLVNGKIKTEEIKYIVENLNLKKAAGFDEIYPFMLKYGGETAIKSLETLFNAMFRSSEYPDDWRKGEIIVIPKSNNRKLEAKEFRPICLLPVTGKIFEKIITERLTIIQNSRNGFPTSKMDLEKNRSTANNLIEIQQEIHRAFKRNEYVLAVFLDIKKAYNCVNRGLLLSIIAQKGIKGQMLDYLKFFLSERLNIVSFNGVKSKYIDFPTGLKVR